MDREMKKRSWLLLLAVIALSVCCYSPLAWGALDNKGTEFILGFLPNYSTPNIELHLTGDVATQVLVEYPANAPTFSQTVAVTPGNVTIVPLPASAAQSWSAGVTANNAVRATSTREFVCYMINRAPYTSDASLAIPVDTFNTEYIVFTYDPAGIFNPLRQFAVFAAYDDTSVNIAFPDGTTASFVLNKGQARYYATSSSSPGYAGTTINASKPIGVTSGNQCLNQGVGACDHVFEMLPPTAAWGKEIPAANIPETANGTSYGIVGSVDGTTVQYGSNTVTVNRGQVVLTSRMANDLMFTSDQPIMVAQIMWNRTPGGSPIGDPALGILTPGPQYMHGYTFSTVGGNQFAENSVTIIAENSEVGTLTLDGTPIPAAAFTSIEGSGYSVTRQNIADGVHTTNSTGLHGITVEGFNSYDSYLYTGGSAFEFINPAGDANPPLCATAYHAGPPPFISGTATDNRPSEDTNGNGQLDLGEDLNGNGIIDKDTGIFFVELLPGATNLTLTTPLFTPGVPTVNFSLALADPAQSGSGTIKATDGAGNVCVAPIDLKVSAAVCDINKDGRIDRIDINAIFAARGQKVQPGDPRDLDGDGLITVNDARGCTLKCTSPNCAIN